MVTLVFLNNCVAEGVFGPGPILLCRIAYNRKSCDKKLLKQVSYQSKTIRSTTLFHIYSYFLTYRLYNIYSYFFILSFNGFLHCESPSPKLSSAFFVRKEPDLTDARPPRTAPIIKIVPRHAFFANFGVLCEIFLDDTERVKHVIGVMGAPIFFHLSYGTYGNLAYSESVELGGIKLRRDITVFRKCRYHQIQRKNLAFFIYYPCHTSAAFRVISIYFHTPQSESPNSIQLNCLRRLPRHISLGERN
jgi:hypothetical protein